MSYLIGKYWLVTPTAEVVELAKHQLKLDNPGDGAKETIPVILGFGYFAMTAILLLAGQPAGYIMAAGMIPLLASILIYQSRENQRTVAHKESFQQALDERYIIDTTSFDARMQQLHGVLLEHGGYSSPLLRQCSNDQMSATAISEFLMKPGKANSDELTWISTKLGIPQPSTHQAIRRRAQLAA
jgi:hypothetical protein